MQSRALSFIPEHINISQIRNYAIFKLPTIGPFPYGSDLIIIRRDGRLFVRQ